MMNITVFGKINILAISIAIIVVIYTQSQRRLYQEDLRSDVSDLLQRTLASNPRTIRGLRRSRTQRLTDEATWYFPANAPSNTMGFEWSEAERQSPGTTYKSVEPQTPAENLIYQSPSGVYQQKEQTGDPADTIYQYSGTTQSYDSQPPSDYIPQFVPVWNSPPESSGSSDIIYQPLTSTVNAKARGQAALKPARTQILENSFDHEDLDTIQTELNSLKDGDEKSADSDLAGLLDRLTFHHHQHKAAAALKHNKISKKAVHSQKLRKSPSWTFPDDLGMMIANRGNVVNTAASDATQNKFEPAHDIIYQAPGFASTADYSEVLPNEEATTAMPASVTTVNMPPSYNVFVYGNLNLGGKKAWESEAALSGAGWAYSGKEGPGNWAMLRSDWGVCATGKSQSPINVELNLKRDDTLPPLQLVGPTEQYQATLVPPMYDNVLTLQGLKGSMTVGGLTMHLRRLSVHTPSQHRFDGAARDGELELLFGSQVGSDTVGLGVSGFLVLGEKTADFLRPLVAAARGYDGRFVPDGFGGQDFKPALYEKDIKPPVWVDTQALAEGMLGHGSNYANYVTYLGSLMHPPCTEGVTRILLKVPIDISADDYAVLADLQGKTARPTQPLNGRQVYDTATGRADGFQSPLHNPYPSQSLQPTDASPAAAATPTTTA